MQNILVIRFGSLGDLCLLGWSLARLAGAPDRNQRRVTLVTKAAFAPLMAEVNGVDRVISLGDPGFAGLRELAAGLRSEKWDLILDAHGILRSHLLLILLGRRPDRRIRKDTTERLSLLRGRKPSPRLDRTMHRRFGELVDGLIPGLADANGPPLSHLAGTDSVDDQILGVAPGAQWDTKRWPQENFAALLRDFRRQSQAPVRVFLGPREESWFTGSALAKCCSDLPGIEIVRQKQLPEVAALLADCTALVTNDSGLLHLSEAVGTPVLAFFGPTVRQFGYFPCLAESEVLEVDLECRPCSRNGKRPCHRHDLACLQGISPDQTQPFLNRMFPQ